MATNLQVNASTQQAVGAFNALAASITNATNQFNQLNRTMQNGTGNANRYASATTAINTGFNNLISLSKIAASTMTTLGAGIQLVFTSLLRELDKLQGFNAIMSVTTKESNDVANSFDFLRKTADKLGLPFDALTSNYAKLVAALPAGTEGLRTAEKAFLGVSMAARTLHASNQDTQLMFYAITQIASKGIVSMEELRRQLGEKLPGVIQIAAKALNTIPEELEKAIRKGVVSSEKFLPIFGDALIRTFGDSSQKASESVSASINRLTNVWVDFVKAVLDSGAGKSIVNVFDALREKLSDPYLIQRFAELIKFLADRFASFITNLTANDIRNGFDTFTHAIEVVITVLDKLIKAFTWIINNGGKAGALIGAAAGAAAGSVAGPYGALAGGVVGGIGGAYLGSSLSPSADQLSQRASSDSIAREAQAQKAREQELLKFNELIPLLQKFNGLNSLNGLDNLFKAENLNTKSLADLNTILNSKEYKTNADRNQAVKDYAKYGTVLGSQSNTLKDVTNSTGKKSAEERKMDASYNHAIGLDANFFDEWNRYNKLLKDGKLNSEQLEIARTKLLNQQPLMEEENKRLKKSQEEFNKGTELQIELALKQVEAKEKIKRQLDDELKMANLRQEDQQVESRVTQVINEYNDVGITLTKQQNDALREKITLIERTKEITAAENSVLAQTVDKYKNQILQQQAIQKALQDPTSGLTKQGATDFVVQQDPNMQGSQQWIDAQKRSLDDYYAYVDGLRNRDLISTETAEQAKAKAKLTYSKQSLDQASDFFGNLATLSESGNKKLAAIGKAAAIAQASIKAYVAINEALASAPPPLNYALAAAVGVAAFANVSKIAGFQKGGYTGNGGTSDIAGVTHGKEFVVNASATSRNRSLLEAMNRGYDFDISKMIPNDVPGYSVGGFVQSTNYVQAPQPVQNSLSQSTSPNVQVIINNKVSDTKASTQERDGPNGREIEITIEKVVSKNINSGGSIASTIESKYNLNRAQSLSY
jgi:tape measure domain-containing protein